MPSSSSTARRRSGCRSATSSAPDRFRASRPDIRPASRQRRQSRAASREGPRSTAHRFLLGLLGAASALGLQVFLTGIESGEELEAFAGLDYRYVQGFWPCPPMARDELAAYLQGTGRRRTIGVEITNT